MTSDSGNLSIDFLAGFTIFMIAFIWVVSMIPGLLINLQGYTIDYDAVAYRTGVILAEDPGEPSLPTSIIPWENLISRNGVVRFGLAISKDTPNILSRKKVDRFFCSSVFSYPDDYQNRSIFGDYPYQFNISLIEMGSTHPPRYIGEGMPATSSTGYIRRLVRIKEPAVAVVDANSTAHPEFLSKATNATYEGNETVHEFSILINKSELLAGTVRDPVFQINPGQEQTIINITHLDQTMFPATPDGNLADRTPCFNINLTEITIRNDPGLLKPPLPPNKIFIDGDGKEYNSTSHLPYIKSNISLVFDPPTYWSVIDKSYINLTFKLVRNTAQCPLPSSLHPENEIYNFTGSRFLNNTFTSPFGYNYSPNNVIQPHLQDAVLEVKVGSGARTATEILIENLAADFKYVVTRGSPTITVQFIDQSKGSPVEWDWDFGDGTMPHGTASNPTHVYTTSGIKTVKLTVKDASGNPASVTKTIDLSAPVANFIATNLSGNAPLVVQFTDTSTGGAPTSWKWTYNTTAGWTQFAATQNPTWTFAAGTYDINLTATNIFGSDDEIKPAYITALPPVVTNISPTAGPLAGGTLVTINGTGFTSAATVSFGGTPGTGVTFVSGTQVTVTSPAHAAGTVDVTVTTPGGTSATSINDRFTYTTAPTVTSINPTSGSPAGGTLVTINGTGFTSAATVSFGGTAGTGVTFISTTQIRVTSPARAAGGTVDVTVTTVGGTSAISVNDRFTYTGVAPTVTSISPTSGPAAGGTSVTINGTGFTSAATTVSFGGTAGTSVTFVSDTQITVISPARAAGGTVDVRVTTPGGTSAITANDQFTYTGVVPAVTSISPTNGPAAGGTSVTITGTGFTSAATVSFGAAAGAGVTFISATQITVTSPAKGDGGTVDVRVTTVGGTSAIVAGDKFTYTGVAPTVTSINPISGPAAGSTSVTITGTGFTSAATVSFGVTAGGGVTFVSDTQITVNSPAKAAGGTVDVKVTTVSGTSAVSASDRFTYTGVAPTVTSISPTTGSHNGGTSVTITGTGFTSAATVNFGATAGTGVTFVSDTQITVTSPSHATGIVDVRVTTVGGTSAIVAGDKFTYT